MQTAYQRQCDGKLRYESLTQARKAAKLIGQGCGNRQASLMRFRDTRWKDCGMILDTPQWRTEWLTRHAKADLIVYDLITDAPHSAVYRPNGAYPVAYLYPSDEGVNL